jgi:hypothetical protein
MLRLVISCSVAVLLGLIAGILLNIVTSRTREIEVQISGPSPIAQPPKPKPTTDDNPAPVVTLAPTPAPQAAPTSPPVIDPKAPTRTKVAATAAKRTKDAQVVAMRDKQRIRHGRRRYDRDDDEC